MQFFPPMLITLSVLIVSCEAFRSARFTASRSTSMQSNLEPITTQDNWKQSVKGLVSFGVAGSAFFGLTTAALAAGAAQGLAPVVPNSAPTGPAAPVVDADGFTISDSGLKSKDTKVCNIVCLTHPRTAFQS